MIARPPPRSLSRRAFLYVVAVCVAILAFEGWREWVAYESALQRAEFETQNLARSLRHHAEDTFEIAEQAVALVAYQLSVSGMDDKGIASAQAFMRHTVETAERVRGLHLLGPDGRLLATTALNLPPGVDYFDHPYFVHHRQKPGSATHFGAPIYTGDGALAITVSRRIEDAEGHFRGVAVAAIDTRYFADVYREIDLGPRGAISLFDGAGTLLTGYPYRSELIGKNLSAALPFAATSQSGSYRHTSDLDGAARIGGYDRGERYPLIASFAISRDEALASWSSGALLRGLATLAFTIAVAILGLRLADQIHRRQLSEIVLAQKEAEFRLLAESASDLVERFDSDGTRTYISPALERLTGYTPEELIGKSAFEVIHEDDRPNVEAAAQRLRSGASEQETVTFRRVRKDGQEIWLETSLRVAAETSGRLSVVGVTRDVTDRKRLEMKLEGMAMRDGLTGLANRRAFDAALAREVARSRRASTPLSLLMIDADRFKRFNDDNGHLAGDACLKAIASVVALGARRPSDIAARYGGEELALLLPDADPEAARAIANDLCRQVQALAIPHPRNLPWEVATVSIGVATINPRDEDAVLDGAWLISTADLALYDAKSQGRNQCVAAPRRVRPRMAG